PKASRRLSLAVGEAGANIQGKSESEAANLRFSRVRKWALKEITRNYSKIYAQRLAKLSNREIVQLSN
ncbi:MAG: hypothetical protein IKN51_03885, partial [Bacteroidaceae bacterium]|nr:hypothetical protein [Bacteroidaceae bacterium]